MAKVPKKIYAPFGVAVERFATIGYHPGLDPSGVLRKCGGLGPGHYNVKHQSCPYKEHKTKDSWTLKLELEEFSANMGFRHPEVLIKRKFMNALNGPGSKEIPDSIYKRKDHNKLDLGTFGTAVRFKEQRISTTPGPGCYGKNHDPYLRFEERCIPKHQWTPLQSFEWDSFINRFRIKRITQPWALAPNRYKIPDRSGINATLAKKVSKRGPYDLFTGVRDNTSIKGYFAVNSFVSCKTWPNALPSTFDRYKHKSKMRHGCFLQAPRFKNWTREMLSDTSMCRRDPNDPGPGHYDIEKPKEVKKNKYAFDKRVRYIRPTLRWEIMPCVGRYNVKKNKCSYKSKLKESYLFKSRVKRDFKLI